MAGKRMHAKKAQKFARIAKRAAQKARVHARRAKA